MSNIQSLLQSLADNLTKSATVNTVYGEPVERGGKTIITVAKITVGFGGGFGEAYAKETEQLPKGEGGGLGGGMMVQPKGFIEITPDKTRYVPIGIGRYVAAAFVVGLVFGKLFWR